jgi:hypothetical protein
MDKTCLAMPLTESLNVAGGSPGRARVILLFVLDGLRPDALNPGDTPTLFRLRQELVHYLNSHAVFPTVTRVNAAAIGTGAYSGTNGIVSNVMYVPEVNQRRPFSLEAVSNGRLVLVEDPGRALAGACTAARRGQFRLDWDLPAAQSPCPPWRRHPGEWVL